MVQHAPNPPLGNYRNARGLRPKLAAAGLALLLAAGASGCVYRMTVQQGNYLDPKQVTQLQVGMTRSQVRFLLGTPMLPDAFDRDRWDYLYYQKVGRLKKPDQRRLTVFFAEDKVARFENEGTLTADLPPAPSEPSQLPNVAPAVVPPSAASETMPSGT
jgi:outer membrane protein assembly factor BamE